MQHDQKGEIVQSVASKINMKALSSLGTFFLYLLSDNLVLFHVYMKFE